MKLPVRHFAWALILLLSTAGCQSVSTPPAPRHVGTTQRSGGEPWVRTELYFGLSRSDGPLVTEEQWRRFTAFVTAQFPAGMTILHADGQYRDNSGALIREPSRVIILLYSKSSAPDADARIQAVSDRYIHDFQQESVLRVDSPVVVQLIEN
jgi:hypothetical protein